MLRVLGMERGFHVKQVNGTDRALFCPVPKSGGAQEHERGKNWYGFQFAVFLYQNPEVCRILRERILVHPTEKKKPVPI